MGNSTGPKFKHYQTSWGKTIDGLTRDKDGRWRIQATGQRFKEPDEQIAVARAIAIIDGIQNPNPVHKILIGETEEGIVTAKVGVQFWQTMRKVLLTDAQLCADKCGIPQLAHFKQWSIPADAVKLSTVWDAYDKYRQSKSAKNYNKTKKAWDDFAASAGSTVDDCHKPQLIKYRDSIRGNSKYAPNTQRLIFSRIKAVVNSANENGVEVGDLPTRLKILKSPGDGKVHNAQPMPKEAYRKLLDNAQPKMKAILLLAMNCCMYIQEVCDLKWSHIDLENHGMQCQRGKTKIVRAAYLWTETVKALKAIKGKGEYCVQSNTGTKYHVESARKQYAAYRRKQAISKSSNHDFNAIRDGAYTVAAKAVLMQKAKVLAGHAVGGLVDNYIDKTPAFVKDACEAVYDHYMK